MGEATALNLSLNFKNIGKLLAADKEELLEINDVGPIAANHIFEFLSQKDNQNLITRLLNSGVELEEIKVKTENILSSKTIVITGSFTNIARSQLKEELIRSGARVSGSVSSRTDYLIVGEKPGSKLKKAVDLGVTILEEAEVLSILQKQ